MIRRLICWWRGHVFDEPMAATWRWKRGRLNERIHEHTGGAIPLGARARRRWQRKERERCRFCTRCGGRRIKEGREVHG